MYHNREGFHAEAEDLLPRSLFLYDTFTMGSNGENKTGEDNSAMHYTNESIMTANNHNLFFLIFQKAQKTNLVKCDFLHSIIYWIIFISNYCLEMEPSDHTI